MTRFALAIVLALTTTVADDSPQSELDKYQGTWVLASEELQGEPTPADKLADVSYTVHGNKLTTNVGGQERTALIRIDPAQSPRAMDWVADNGNALKSIYEWDDDSIKICSTDSGDRPTEFKTSPGSRHRIRVWKRKP